MKVAIVGANSFLASYIINKIKSDFDLMLYGQFQIDSFNFKSFIFPDKKIDFEELLDFDVIIYTAGAGIQNDLKESKSNIYTLNTFYPIELVNFLREKSYKGKFISFGSYFEIGDEPLLKYYDESDIMLANNPVPNDYCISKRLLTKYLSSVYDSFKYYHFIISNLYGPGENKNRLIPYLINSLKNDREIKLTSGHQVRQYIHAKDVAQVVHNFINNNFKPGLYNITVETPIKVKDLVKTVFKVMEKENLLKEEMFGKSIRTDVKMPYLLLTTDKLKAEAGFKTQINIESGIKSYLL